MSQSPSLSTIIRLREQLLPSVRGPIQLPEPSLCLNLESRRDSEQRMFKHIHQSCLLHTENFRAASKIKHLYLLDAYIDMAKVENPLAIYMAARSMLEFSAFLHEVSMRLREAAALGRRQWLDGGRKFFGIVVRARYATSRSDYKALLHAERLPEDLQRPMNVKNCIQGLSEEAEFRDISARYDSFCDFVHHNLSSGVVANAGSRVASAAHSSRGGMLVMRNGGAVTQYQYPVPLKGKRALDETADAFFKDAEACVRWINEMPESPYSREQVRLFTGTALGVTPIEHATGASGTHVRIPRNDPCPCGSGKKYKHCCLQ